MKKTKSRKISRKNLEEKSQGKNFSKFTKFKVDMEEDSQGG